MVRKLVGVYFKFMPKSKVQREKQQKSLKEARFALGKFVQLNSNVSKCSAIFGVARFSGLYWEKKVSDPTVHPGNHGGLRWKGYSDVDYQHIKMLIWEHCQEKPTS